MISSSDLSDNINIKNFEKEVTELFQPPLVFLDKELGKIRTNRAHPSLVEDIKVSVYGGSSVSAIKHLALINASDAVTLIIQPFDIGTLSEIEKALSQSDIGLNPKNDGKSIKIALPPMSKERRAELVKVVSKKKEETILQVRKVRQDILNEIKKAEKEKKVSQDCSSRLQKNLQQVCDKIIETCDLYTKKKEQMLQE